MVKSNLDGLVINHLDFIRYLTGFTGSAALLIITKNKADFVSDFRYKEQSAKQVKGAKVHILKKRSTAALEDFPQYNTKNARIGYPASYLSVAELNIFKEKWQNVIPIPSDEVFKELGWVKDKDEINSITKACEIGDIAFERVLNIVKPGIRESEVSAELEYQMKMLGSERPAFETIIASGYRSALPHGVASRKKIKKGDFVTFDFGATVNGYVSDMTRTVVVGKATSKQKKIYNLVLKAQKASIRKIKAGVLGKTVDEAGRKIITKGGFGKNFGHGTGHGIGFFVHVGPNLSAVSEDKLKPNNVITVEPGIYFSGWGGVRIEDDVVVTRTGNRILNKSPKKLLEL
jgi:Xaa-Pro aminopeptidase